MTGISKQQSTGGDCNSNQDRNSEEIIYEQLTGGDGKRDRKRMGIALDF